VTSTTAPSPILKLLKELHQRIAPVKDGAVATYIPELARADPEWFGICVATATGSVYEVGDSSQPFTIQSISKPLVYGLALEDHGRTEVLKKIGVEPTGDAFNSISLDPSGRPKNPMINAGAIAATGLVAGRSPDKRFERMLATLSLYAGRDLTVDEAVYRSESETGFRNRAIGYMLRNFSILEEDPTPSLELYFRQCAISVTCRDLAITAATLANRGINPITGKQAVRGEYVESILSVMSSTGMYDYAGEWIYRVGMPAKSGVAGGIIAVLPGQLGIAVFSPRLDPRGNSTRGILVCDELSRRLDLHLFNHPRASRSVIRASFDAGTVTSCRVRTPAESAVLQAHGSAIRVYQLQGNIAFSTAETVVAEVLRHVGGLAWVILDLKWVLDLNESACVLLGELIAEMAPDGPEILFTHAERLPLLRRILRLKLANRPEARFQFLPENDSALEWAENQLIARHLTDAETEPEQAVTPDRYDVLAGLTAEEVGVIAAMFARRAFAPGAVIVRTGEPADALYFLARGRASAKIRLDTGETKRLAAFSAGMAFGEMAAVERSTRSATVVAETEVECDIMRLDDLDALTTTHPRIKICLLENLCRGLSRKLRKANCERAVFDE
jgi:glutaminase